MSKTIYYKNIKSQKGTVHEQDGFVTVEWDDGETLKMQSSLFYGDWLGRTKSVID